MSAPPPTLRPYLDDPRRKTALATVTGRVAGGFTLDKTLLHASDPAYHHRQPHDRGHVLAEGHKLKVHRVAWRDGRLVHYTDGPLPAVGAKAQLHLDAPRRAQGARAHAAMHLALAALLDQRATLLRMPEVVGGGRVNFQAVFREPPAAALPRLVEAVHRALATPAAVSSAWQPREQAARAVTHHALPIEAVAPGEPTLRLVRIGEGCVLPCDAPHVTHTREIGRVRALDVRPGREGVRWALQVDES